MTAGAPQVVVISGGSRGLGQALVSDFLGRGQIVATFSRSCTPFIEGLKSEPLAAFHWEELDATDHRRLKDFVLQVASRFGRIDVLINNAALGVDGLLTLMRSEEIHQAVAVNLEGPIQLIQAVARVMLAQESGSIVNISSVHAITGHRGVSIYSATKAALHGLTRSLARELGCKGIRVNSVAPGYFPGGMAGSLTEEQRERIIRRTPLGRLATAEDVVGVVRYLTGPDSRFVTGQTLVVDGGFTC